jgi:hypothetical protein
MNKRLLKQIGIVELILFLFGQLGFGDAVLQSEKIRSWVDKHPFVSLTLKDESTVEGQLKSADDTSCVIKLEKEERKIPLIEIVDAKTIRTPGHELAYTVIVGVGSLLFALLVYAKTHR